MLIRVPVEHILGVLHAGQLTGPVEEGLAVGRVVGHGAHDNHAGLGPIDVGIVPHLDLRVATARRQLIKQALFAGKQVGHGRAGHQGDFGVIRHSYLSIVG